MFVLFIACQVFALQYACGHGPFQPRVSKSAIVVMISALLAGILFCVTALLSSSL
jgi:hypothetical protein